MTSKSSQTKPSIVFCHGLWADGSCFSKLIVPLQAEGFEFTWACSPPIDMKIGVESVLYAHGAWTAQI